MTARAILIGVLLSMAGIVWIHQASLMQSPWNPYAFVYLLSVPPVPAVAFLFLLSVSAALLLRLRLRPLSSRELAVIYLFLTLTVPATTFGIVEMLLPWPTAPIYLGSPQNGLTEIATQYFPAWVAPQDPEVVRTMFEGSEDGRVPWRPWALPLLGWTALSGLIFACGLGLVTLLHRQWADHERLRFPLLLLPLSVTGSAGAHSEVRGVFRNPLTWLAIALVFAHHAMNVAHLYNPAITALMDRYPLGRIFTEQPWTAFRSLIFMHRPQMIGFSYFVAVDVLLSGWVFFVAQSAVRMLADIFGYQGAPGFPFAPQQGSGAYTIVFFSLLWVAREHLRRVWNGAVGRTRGADRDELLSYPTALWGVLACFGVLVWWAAQMGMNLWLAAGFFFLVVSWAVVYARIRAEAGMASMWVFPFIQHLEVPIALMGTGGLMRGADARSLVMLTMFGWISHGYFPSLIGTVTENNRLAEETDLPRRKVPWLMLLAFVVGMAGAYAVTLRSYYQEGANVLHGGGAGGGYTVSSAMGQWNAVTDAVSNPGKPNLSQVGGMAAGAVVTALLVLARRVWLRFPLHPLGYAMALNYGYCLWGPFAVTWLLKLIIDRLGGARLYHRLMPFFLGLAIGDLMAGGLIWLLLGIFGPEITKGYVVQFG